MTTDRSPEYYEALRELVAFRRPVAELRPRLARTGPSYRGPNIELRRSHLAHVLRKYLNGEISVADVANWAELLELRDGLCFELGHDETLIQVIHKLANPLLEGALEPARAQSMLAFLEDFHRFLSNEEIAVMEWMLSGTKYAARFIPLNPSLMVTEMNDGGMGSLRFVSGRTMGARFGGEIAAADYIDSDGVFVSITINIDRNGALFELDIWKVDNTPLKRFPRPDLLTRRQVGSTTT